MASPEVIDLTRLLAPITDTEPSGADLRQDASPTGNYHTLKSARAAARAAERNNIHDGDTSEADEHWRKIISLAPDVIATQSKDLEIASWLTEALIRRHGFTGLKEAFQLIHGLIDQYWDGLFPLPDEDGLETRIASLAGLNGEGAEGVLIAPIRKVSITEGYDPGPFCFWQYQQTLDLQRVVDEQLRESKAEKLGFSLEDIERAVEGSSELFFIDQLNDISSAIDTYKNISKKLDELCGLDISPPTSNIISTLEECRGALSHLGRDKLPEESTITEAPTNQAGAVADQPVGASQPKKSSVIDSREAAFKQILEAAKFFKKTEPHSPVSYILEKAVKWGNMPLNELINELIPDSSSREKYSELTGVASSED